MATEASILAVVRSSRPNFKNPNDKIAFIIHAAFLSAGYSLIATGDKAFEENPPTDGEETGIDGWNSSEDGYAFVYVKSDNGEKKSVLVKCVAIGLALVVDVLNLKDDSKEPLHIQINVKDHVVEEDKHSNYGDIYKNLRGLVQILNTGIFNKLDTKSGSCSSTSSCSKGPGENHTNNNVFPDERQQLPPVGPRQHFTGASSSTSEYDLIISTCMEVQQEGDDYEEWEVAICAARCAATGGPNPLAALLHKPAQLRRAIIHFVNQFRRGN